MKKINLDQKFALFNELWTPKIISELNDYQIKIAKVEGDFVWHNHSDTDEFFLVVEGTLFIEFESETMELNTGELYVVPRGVQHRPYAKEECKIMLIESAAAKPLAPCWFTNNKERTKKEAVAINLLTA